VYCHEFLSSRVSVTSFPSFPEFPLAARGAKNDARKESRKPDLDSIRLVGSPLSAANGWRARREIIDAMPHHTRAELKGLYIAEKVSLGIVRPTEIIDLKVEPVEQQWKPQWEVTLKQFNLFGDQPKPLQKLPYKFSYVFRCADTGERPHSAMIEDWELGVLYRKEVERLGGEEEAVESVKRKYLDEMCDKSRDTRFFMGTVFPYNTWVVICVFWPPKSYQPELF
jgi:hypothetical protein